MKTTIYHVPVTADEETSTKIGKDEEGCGWEHNLCLTFNYSLMQIPTAATFILFSGTHSPETFPSSFIESEGEEKTFTVKAATDAVVTKPAASLNEGGVDALPFISLYLVNTSFACVYSVEAQFLKDR